MAKLQGIVVVVAVILAIPLIAMQFTREVQWTTSDFILAGVLLIAAGLAYEAASSVLPRYKVAILMVVLAVLGLVWLQLAVGVIPGVPGGT